MGKMKLMTKEIEKKLKSRQLCDEVPLKDQKVITMYFNPLNSQHQWYIISGEQLSNGDWYLFGLMHIYEWEVGYVLLSQLEAVCLPLEFGIEREKTVNDVPLLEVFKEHAENTSGYERYLEYLMRTN